MGDDARILWRLVDTTKRTGGFDLAGEWCTTGSYVQITWVQYHVTRETPKGMWVRSGAAGDRIFQEERWVKHNTRYVAATKEEAKQNARAKRAYHVTMCRKRLESAEKRLRAIEAEVSDG